MGFGAMTHYICHLYKRYIMSYKPISVRNIVSISAYKHPYLQNPLSWEMDYHRFFRRRGWLRLSCCASGKSPRYPHGASSLGRSLLVSLGFVFACFVFFSVLHLCWLLWCPFCGGWLQNGVSTLRIPFFVARKPSKSYIGCSCNTPSQKWFVDTVSYHRPKENRIEP